MRLTGEKKSHYDGRSIYVAQVSCLECMVTKKPQVGSQSHHETPAVLKPEPEKMEHEIQMNNKSNHGHDVLSNVSGSGSLHAVSPVSSLSPQGTSSVQADQTGHNHDTQNKKDLERHAKELVKELDQETKKMKKSRGKEPKPPKNPNGGKNTKRSVYGGIAALFVMGALVVGSFVGVRLVQQNQENRSQAAICCNGGVCNDGHTFGGDSSAWHSSCDVRANEACDGHGGVRSGGGACSGGGPVDNLCGDGTPADGCWVFRCPQGCGNDPEGNETSCDGGEPGAWKSIVDCTDARLDSNECGQIDKFKNNKYCGVIKVQCGTDCTPTQPTPTTRPSATPTQRAVCNSTCSTDSQCTGQANLYCKVDKTWSAWVDKTSDISNVGSGDLGSLNEYIEAGVRKQHFVRGGKIWYRTNQGGSWSSWQDVTSNVSSVGSGTITSFKAHLDEQGVTKQHLVRGGRIWYQHNQGGWSGFSDVTNNVSSVGSGTITGFSSYMAYGTHKYQHLVRGGRIYAQDNINGWSSWVDVTNDVSSVGSGTITSLTSQHTTAKVEQYLVRGNRMWYRAGTDKPGNCRLRSNPTSLTCSPAGATPTPTRTPTPTPTRTPTPTKTPTPTIPIQCNERCTSETTSNWTECTVCTNASTNTCLQREVQCRQRAVAHVGISQSQYPAPITSTTNTDRIKWFNWGAAQTRLSCGTACGLGHLCCDSPITPTPTKTPTPTPINSPTPTVTPPPGTLACTGITPINPVIALGTSKEFTCAGTFPVSATVKFAKFQFIVDGGSAVDFGTPADNVYKATMTARDPGSYVVRCQVCGGTSVATATCSNWQELTP